MLTRIPSSISQEAMRQELATGAATRWPALAADELQDINVVRLNRRVNGPNQSSKSANGVANWIPSTSVRIFATKALCEAILNAGGTVLGFAFREARPFQPAKRRCMRCGELGVHSAQYYRNTPRCRHCGLAHETRGCPTHQQGRAHSSRREAVNTNQADRSPRGRAAQPQ